MSGGSIAFLFLDIDLFAAVNDSHGRNFADKVLAAQGRKFEVNGERKLSWGGSSGWLAGAESPL